MNISQDILNVLNGYQELIDAEYALTTLANAPRLKRLRHQRAHLLQTLKLWQMPDGSLERCENPFVENYKESNERMRKRIFSEACKLIEIARY